MKTTAGTASPTVTGQDIDAFFESSYRLSHLARRRLQAHLAAYHLTPPQYTAMRNIRAHANAISVSALAEAVFQVTPTITGILNRLEERGLVIRRRSTTDRRHQLVSLTRPGEEILDKINADIRRFMGDLLAELSPAERETLNGAIHSLSNWLDSQISVESREVNSFEQ